jgi:hypothetical protein
MRRVFQISAVLVAVGTMSACDDRRSPVTPTPLVVTQVPAPAPVPNPAPVPVPGTLAIESFSVVEYGSPNWLSYAPLIRVRAPEGAVTVIRLQFVIPGIGATSACTNKRVEGSESRDLFREVYGDYEYSIAFGQAGVRATGEPVKGTITYRDDTGAIGVLQAEAPVVPGQLPTTYTGGSTAGEWCR